MQTTISNSRALPKRASRLALTVLALTLVTMAALRLGTAPPTRVAAGAYMDPLGQASEPIASPPTAPGTSSSSASQPA